MSTLLVINGFSLPSITSTTTGHLGFVITLLYSLTRSDPTFVSQLEALHNFVSVFEKTLDECISNWRFISLAVDHEYSIALKSCEGLRVRELYIEGTWDMPDAVEDRITRINPRIGFWFA
jgi:hypothetical protein